MSPLFRSTSAPVVILAFALLATLSSSFCYARRPSTIATTKYHATTPPPTTTTLIHVRGGQATRLMTTADAIPVQTNPMLKNPAENFMNAVALGTKKGLMAPAKTFLMGILAGLQIGVGAAMAIAALSGVPGVKEINPALAKILFGMIGLPCSLLMVMCTGAELFTGNTALVSASYFEGKVNKRQLAKNWFWSYLGNFVGTGILAIACHYAGTYSGMTQAIAAIGDMKASLPFGVALARGAMCNWLVCTAVWMSIATSDLVSKAVTCLLVVTIFGALGFEHSVANMFVGPMAALSGSKASYGVFLLNNMLPVTVGNVIGGVVFVSLIQCLAFGKIGQKLA